MSPPTGLLGAAMLFWGQQTGLLGAAAPCAVLIEAWRMTGRRFELARADFSRISDFSAVLFFFMGAYLYFSQPANQAFMTLSAWLPLAFVPLMAAQLYSAEGVIDVRALFVFMRNQPLKPAWTADISFPYLLLCLLAAGAANNRTPLFYPEMAILVGWALWRARPAGSSSPAWIALMILTGGLGYVGQDRLALLQTEVEKRATGLLFGDGGARIDPEEVVMAIGHIGKLKQSERIALRVKPAAGRPAPRLLRTASYNAYRGRRWLAWDADFSPLREGAGEWRLRPRTDDAAEISLSIALDGGSGPLPLPPGTSAVRGFAAGAVTRSRLGTVKVEQGPGLAVFEAEASSASAFDGPADRRDVEVPAGDAVLLAHIARELGLSPRRPKQALASIKNYFDGGFRYSLYRDGPDPGPKALEEFLIKTRAGHCEYFATAAVLLLRSAGIPARFAAGYSVQEYSKLERAWIARDRHAHAWALAYVDGAWIELDATPASWASVENGRAPWWEALRDVSSWAGYRLSRLLASAGAGHRPRNLWLIVLPAALALAGWKRLSALKAVRSQTLAAAIAAPPPGPGRDSPWYAVERLLAEEGFARHSWEGWLPWLERISAIPGSQVSARNLRPLLDLHCRQRFDPAGLAAAEREALGAGVGEWLRGRERRAR